ncbi:DUF5686 and carboxypeptidase-like regulatory domain-containing protein [Abyssalbus ytuae]|uniref:DUF5686 and carboxypeptidase regulatory-like domain-containing protein n=1 Tax=Abyssalbus ytuae TaxID=2926907 RepID=A0A9E7D4K2_9FLAO|nr:DUF5686 and carboxypeptidase-like regulatory domain-containing protein [Abyssalbus ytuae]UOB19029.1 DUF5686 and carboxypeptidase regulatory-like domain-containing protein [Abyssalbus ytuae]
MKNLIIFVSFFLTFLTFSQNNVNGIVIDKNSNAPLPFANIITDKNQGLITNADGSFIIENAENLNRITVSYVGYKTLSVNILPGSSYYKIELEPDIEKLNEVILVGKENPAIPIIKKTIENRKKNDPESVLKSYSFKSYNKLLVTANPDSINGAIDSVYIRKKGKLEFKQTDSSNYELKKQLSRSHLYITEKISEYKFSENKGRRKNILGSRMAGFKEPIYEFLAVSIQSFSFYKNKYTLFGTDYVNPIANNALNIYHYRILDTVSTGKNSLYMIYYFPKKRGKTAGLEGVLYIDTKSFGLQKAVAQLKAVIDVQATQEFEYQPNEKIWFPVKKEIKVKKGDSKEKINLFNGAVGIQFSNEKDSSIVRTNKNVAEEMIQLISTEKNFEIQLNIPVEIKGRGLEIEVDEKASDRDAEFWNLYRSDSITARETETYKYLDSITEAEKIEKKIYVGRKLLQGYLPSKYFDFDLRNLVKYNNHEGFRLGLGLITNTNFSSIYRLNGYGVFGTKDKEFKYGVGASARINKYTNSWLGLNYTDDLVETGSNSFITDTRAFSLFEPRLFNITSFYKVKKISPYISHDITPKFIGKLQFNHTDIVPTYDYNYIGDGETFDNFTLSTLVTSFQWNPFNEYMFTKEGKKPVKTKYPQFALQVSKSFDGFLGGDFDFTKLNLRAYYELKPLNKGKSTFLFNAGWALGDIPLTHLYNLSPNQPTKYSILRRFSIAGRDSFETMFFNEFFSDRYASLQIKHFFKRFKLLNKIKPEVVLISRFALGDVSDKEKHINVDFNSLKNGYMESGLEINKIFKGFGLSAMYRDGAYHLPRFDDNLSFKFTYYFTLGF